MPKFLINVKAKGAKRAGSEIKGLTGNVDRLASAAKRAAIALGVGFLAKQLADIGRVSITTAARFETLKVRLNVLYGSVQRGTQAFDNFNKVAATTPFMLEDVVNAGASLKAFGLDAEEMIKPLADLAAFMQVDMSVAASNMGRAFVAGAGAADMFREAGVNQMIADMAGVMDATTLPIEEFRENMFKVLVDPDSGIAGMTTKMADTWSGAVSNMQDSTDRLKGALGDELIAVLRPKLDEINKVLSKFGDIGWDNVAKSFLNNGQIMMEATGKLFALGGELAARGFALALANTWATIIPQAIEQLKESMGMFGFLIEPAAIASKGYKALGESIIEAGSQTERMGEISSEMGIVLAEVFAKILADSQKLKDDREDGTETEIESGKKIVKTGGDNNKAKLNFYDAEVKGIGQLMGAMGQLNTASKGSALVSGRLAQAAAIADTYAGATKAFAQGGVLGFATGAAIIAAGLANVVEISRALGDIKSAATGADFVTSGPQMMLVGDNPSGREHVQITPLGGDPNYGNTSGSAITVNVSGNVMTQDFVEGDLAEAIRQAARRGTDFGVS